jgi:hypothetical protein
MVTHLVGTLGLSPFEALNIRRDLLPGLPVAGTIVFSKGVLDADHSLWGILNAGFDLKIPGKLGGRGQRSDEALLSNLQC